MKLSKLQKIMNVLYYIFRIFLYGLGFGFLANNFNEVICLILMAVFVVLAYEHKHIKEKIIKYYYVEKETFNEILKQYSTTKNIKQDEIIK